MPLVLSRRHRPSSTPLELTCISDQVQDVSNSVDASHELTTPRSGLAAENAAHLTAEAIADNDVDAKLTPAPEPELSDIALGEDHLEMEPAVQAARNMVQC
eukprot:SAG11_NODE_2068_length_3864_cov_6.492430_4_plen_101_part_00